MRNLKLAARMLLKAPFVTAIAVLSLALGIGANAAIYSMFNQLLLRPLPVRDASQLVNLSAPGPAPGSNSCNDAGSCEEVFSYAMFRDLEKAQTPFTGIAAHRSFGTSLSFNNEPMTGDGMMVSGSYFPVLGVTPTRGRLLTPEDDKVVGANYVAVIGYAFWQSRLGGDPAIVGKLITINGKPYTIVGVAPQGFDGTTTGVRPMVYVPISMRGELQRFTQWENRQSYWVYLFARLKPGVDREAAAQSINSVYHALINDVEAPLQKQMTAKTMEKFRAKKVLLEPGARGQSTIHREARTPLLMLFAVTGMVLLIACANIANLLLARAGARARETAIRAAIGAGRRQLIREALTESLLLAAGGGLLGVLAAYWGVAGLVALGPADIPRLGLARVDAPVLGFVVLLTLGAGLVFGLAPALRMAGQLPQDALREGGRAGSPGRRDRLRASLVIGEIALALVLLTGAGLLVRSAIALDAVDPGFDPRGVLVGRVSLPEAAYPTPEIAAQTFERIADGLAQAPGAAAAGVASTAPFEGGSDNGLIPEGRPLDIQSAIEADMRLVTPGYIPAMGLRLRAGRAFTAADRAGAPLVMLVNETFARLAWPGQDPIGNRVACCEPGPNGEPNWKTVVGVVGDVRARGVGRDAPSEFYLPVAQAPRAAWRWINRTMTLAVRAPSSPIGLAPAMRDAVWRVDRSLPVYSIGTMDDRRSASLATSRFSTVLLTAFGGIALLLAAIGVYGVISYGVAQRTQEIGIRVALGAARANVLRLVVGQAATLMLIGLGLGLVGAALLSRLLAGLLFQVSPTDPPTFGLGLMVLALVSLAAALVPALRAARVDPADALRAE